MGFCWLGSEDIYSLCNSRSSRKTKVELQKRSNWEIDLLALLRRLISQKWEPSAITLQWESEVRKYHFAKFGLGYMHLILAIYGTYVWRIAS